MSLKNDYFHFLFDLDGTLVHTDFIYIEVWKELLNKYNILVNNEFFNNFIKGKSDIALLNYLLPQLTREDIEKISIQKDELFIEKLNNYEEEILLDGVLDFFEKNKERQIAIVTSCNKSAAKFILKKTKLDKFVNILIASEDCYNHKPHPDPYLNAIKQLNVKKEDCIIFEDSYSGYTSAKNTKVYNICLIINDESCEDIKNAHEIKIRDYKKLNITQLIKDKNMKTENDEYLLDNLYKTLQYLPIKNITKNNSNLKSGYICDIFSYNLKYNDNTSENIILKISNFDNSLSKTAIELNMYKNEKYFYSYIYPLLTNINIPRFFGSFELNNKDGIILENLNKYSGTFNIDLNKNIDILLRVINNIFNMHNRFYFENLNDKIDTMKNLLTVNQISYYSKLITNRFDKFMQKNTILLTENNITNLKYIYNNFNKILDESSTFPLSFCHGDLKSPNIFYKDNIIPYFLDWQYIHLNKGISDIVFLLVESIDFDKFTVDIVIKYYYKLIIEQRKYSYEEYLKDFKNALCIFPFFVCVWFNSEDSDKLLDSVFPIRFMKNLLKYYDFYL